MDSNQPLKTIHTHTRDNNYFAETLERALVSRPRGLHAILLNGHRGCDQVMSPTHVEYRTASLGITLPDDNDIFNPLKPEITNCHLHPLQAANCCRNSRLVVNEDDLCE